MKFFDFFKKHYILTNFLWMIILVVVLAVGVFFWLDYYTHHGEKQIVPNVYNKTEADAANLLSGNSLNYSVIDSVFRPELEPGRVVEQEPKPGSMVKEGRKIYLIVNAMQAQMIPVPDVVDMSLRQARMQLEGAEFVIGKIDYQPSDYKDLVLAVVYKDSVLKAADKIPFKSSVVLRVGKGSDYSSEADTLVTSYDEETDGYVEVIEDDGWMSDEEIVFE